MIATPWGGTALTSAIYKRKPDIATYLVEQGLDFNTNGVSPMLVLYDIIEKTTPGNPIHEDFKNLRDVLIARGVQWPPMLPEEVLEKMGNLDLNPVFPKAILPPNQ